MGEANDKDGLPDNWTRHTAPTVTGQSTYTKPKIKSRKTENRVSDKRQKISENVKTTFKVELAGTDWLLVFTTKGSHFFYNKATKRSHWRIEDPNVQKSVDEIDKDIFLLLIAKSRGLKLDDYLEEQLNDKLTPKDEHKLEPNTQEDRDERLSSQEEPSIQNESDTPALKVKAPLISGYSSSEDDSDGDNEEDEIGNDPILQEVSKAHESPIEEAQVQIEDEGESSEEENAFDLADLEGLSSDEEEQKTSQEAELIFLQLLQESGLNPFSPWETESLKIINDPRFQEIDNNRDRKKIFDEWVPVAIQQKRDEEHEKVEKHKEEEGPLVRFIKFLESKELDRIYVDFKKKWKKQLKKLELGDRDKEKVYNEYVIYHKKSDDEKVKIFKSFLMGAKIFHKNVQEANNLSILEGLDEGKINGLEYESAYKTLYELERELNISESLKFNTKYYIVDVKQRIALIVEIAKLWIK